jgi:hypothetical protein
MSTKKIYLIKLKDYIDQNFEEKMDIFEEYYLKI